MAEAGGTQPTLEQALRRLDEIADLIERGDLELDESMQLFEEGVGLLRHAESILQQARGRIEQLRASGEGFSIGPMEEPR